MEELNILAQGVEKATQEGVFSVKEVVLLNSALVKLHKVFNTPLEEEVKPNLKTK